MSKRETRPRVGNRWLAVASQTNVHVLSCARRGVLRVRMRASQLSGPQLSHMHKPVGGTGGTSCWGIARSLVRIARLLQVVCDFNKILECAKDSSRDVADVFKLCFVGEVVARVGGDPPPSVCLPCSTASIFGEKVDFYICCPSDPEYRAPAWLASAIRHRAMGVTRDVFCATVWGKVGGVGVFARRAWARSRHRADPGLVVHLLTACSALVT